MQSKKIVIARGDGIGPEIMSATLDIITTAGAKIDPVEIEIGEKVYMRGINAGITPSDWEKLLEHKVFLKAPVTTPQGGGFKSLNVTVRKSLGLFANVRPCKSFAPFVQTKHPGMDVVIIRENEEDLYAGIEYRQSAEIYSSHKIFSRQGCERIVRYAFEFAKTSGRKKVTCFTKDNIMKMTDGLFHKIFDEIGVEYPNLEKEHWIVDIGAAKLADTPEVFDVVVMPNLYGDILSDVAAQIAGSVGLAGSSNIGATCAMFEAIHGSAPRRAGQNMANPSGLLQAAVLMLVHIGQGEIANKVQNAWLKTIEDGIHTYDIYQEGLSAAKVGTKEFAAEVIKRLGQTPSKLASSNIKGDSSTNMALISSSNPKRPTKKLVGIDLFVDYKTSSIDDLLARLKTTETTLSLKTISNRGVKVWPEGIKETLFTDQWRCRFLGAGDQEIKFADCLRLMESLSQKGVDLVKSENLYQFEDERGYSLDQGG
ncbi:MAG TPA: NADP-dependent isocitrate dehydrogenase [Oligoflexia bacterium]|nr:NADP-dependent isocitrate dehydrogenase [Oligoflexia bacterium]HMP26415.1 NADP-dependent isocitrate dehydrogenase [Oligoflexia bacterium]